jgi:hypothetical protein
MLGTANALDAQAINGLGINLQIINTKIINTRTTNCQTLAGNLCCCGGEVNQIGSGAGGETAGLLAPGWLVAELQWQTHAPKGKLQPTAGL